MLADSQYFARKPESFLNNYILFTWNADKINTITLLFKKEAKTARPAFASLRTYFTRAMLKVRDWQGRKRTDELWNSRRVNPFWRKSRAVFWAMGGSSNTAAMLLKATITVLRWLPVVSIKRSAAG